MEQGEIILESILPQALARLVSQTNNIAQNQDYSFQLAENSLLKSKLQASSNALLALSSDLINYIVKGGCSNSSSLHPSLPPLQDLEDVLDNFDKIIETTDDLLENVLAGRGKNHISKHLAPSGPILLSMQLPSSPNKSTAKRTYLYSQNIRRPQLEFTDQVDNSNTPFVRKIIHKPNAKRPLDYGMPGSTGISDSFAQHIKTLGITSANDYGLPHPYEFEIENIEYPPRIFQKGDAIKYKSSEDTPFHYIDTPESLELILADLNSAEEIAVDLEHHDYRSYQGFTCLMQISTRSVDYVIDTLKLRSQLHVLNKCFTDPNIVKVFHGAEMDIQWLQKDLGLYIVGLFDTYHASHSLELEGHSLAHLLTYYCSINVDKKYQLADWRIRPLPQEMMDYARSDTHYLLFVFDCMRNALLEISNPETHNILVHTLQASAETSLKKYEKEIYSADGLNPTGWKNALSKCGIPLNAEQIAVFKGLHAWRDHAARREDESIRYMLPQHMLISIANSMPSDPAGIFACCNPVPVLVRLNVDDIVSCVDIAKRDARAHALARELELQIINKEYQARQEEWEMKKKLGPIHTTFVDGDSDVIVGKTIINRVKVTTKSQPELWLISTSCENSTDTAAWSIAEQVRKHLVLLPPMLQEAVRVVEKVAPPLNPISIAPIEPKVIVIADVKSKERKRKSEAADNQSDELAVVKKKKKGKRTGDSTLTADAKNPAQLVEPFDYANASSAFSQPSLSKESIQVFDPRLGTDKQSQSKRERKISTRPPNAQKSLSFVKPK